MSARGCVVVGGGLAAATLVQTLRDEGFAEPLTLIGDESDRPYERPALSKDYLQGKTAAGDLYVHPENWYTEHQVDTRLGDAVTEIDRDTCSVRLRSGGTVGYSQLVLATGASPRTLSLPGHRPGRRSHAPPHRGLRFAAHGAVARPPTGDHRRRLDRAGGGCVRSVGRL